MSCYEVYARLCFSMIYVDINAAILMMFLGVLFPICSRCFPIFGMNPCSETNNWAHFPNLFLRLCIS
jgi:hypothetical protein